MVLRKISEMDYFICPIYLTFFVQCEDSWAMNAIKTGLTSALESLNILETEQGKLPSVSCNLLFAVLHI